MKIMIWDILNINEKSKIKPFGGPKLHQQIKPSQSLPEKGLYGGW